MVYLSHDLKHSGYDYLNKNQLKIDNIPETLAPVGGGDLRVLHSRIITNLYNNIFCCAVLCCKNN